VVAKISELLLKFVLGFIVILVISVPALGFVYLGAWLIDWLVIDINFDSWITHVVIFAISFVLFVIALNTKEGDELFWTSVTGKR